MIKRIILRLNPHDSIESLIIDAYMSDKTQRKGLFIRDLLGRGFALKVSGASDIKSHVFHNGEFDKFVKITLRLDESDIQESMILNMYHREASSKKSELLRSVLRIGFSSLMDNELSFATRSVFDLNGFNNSAVLKEKLIPVKKQDVKIEVKPAIEKTIKVVEEVKAKEILNFKPSKTGLESLFGDQDF